MVAVYTRRSDTPTGSVGERHLILRNNVRMTDFIATLAPDRFDNWTICKRNGLWGVVGRGTNWRANARNVRRGDRIFVWRGAKPNGFIAQLEALDEVTFTESGGVIIPWPEPEWFGAVFPIRVVTELLQPIGDTFPASNGRVAKQFGFSNTLYNTSWRRCHQRLQKGLRPHLSSPDQRGLGAPTSIHRRLTQFEWLTLFLTIHKRLIAHYAHIETRLKRSRKRSGGQGYCLCFPGQASLRSTSPGGAMEC